MGRINLKTVKPELEIEEEEVEVEVEVREEVAAEPGAVELGKALVPVSGSQVKSSCQT